MKNMTIALLLAALILACALATAAMAEEITADALQDTLDNSLYINLFDVRSEEEYAAGAIDGAVSFPLDTLEAEISAILDGGFSNLSVPVFLYGATAEDSQRAAEIMTGLGFSSVRYLPGLSAWTGELVPPDRLLGDLMTTDIYGQAVDAGLIADSRLVMVNVWATYCGPCINEMQDLGELSRSVAGQGVMIIGLLSDCSNADLSANETNVTKAREIVASTKADYPQLLPSRTMYRISFSSREKVPIFARSVPFSALLIWFG